MLTSVPGREAPDPAPIQTVPSVRVGEMALLLLLPIAAVFVFGISVVDQHGSADPEYYTGYGQSFARMWEVFGPTYYAARFPVMFLNVVSQGLLPGVGGYAVVRLLVFAVCAVPLYLLARGLYGRSVALATYVFLLANPLLPRILCWDLTTFLSIPSALAGVTLWYASSGVWSGAVLAAGFAFGVSLSSHVFTGTAIATFLLVEAVFSMRGARVGWFLARCVTLFAGFALCVALGLAFYRWRMGGVSLAILWSVTIVPIQYGQRYAETHYVPFSAYYATNYELYVPLFTTLLLVAVNRNLLLKNTVTARIAWFSIAYVCAYAAAVFGLHMNIVQFFWYFGHLTIVVYLGVPVILGRLTQDFGRAVTIWFAAGLIAVAVVVRAFFPSVVRVAAAAAGDGDVVLGLGIGCAVCMAGLLVRQRVVGLGCAALAGALIQMPFLSMTHLSVYDLQGNAIETPLFETIIRYHALLNRYDRPGQRVRTWYATKDASLMSVSSSNLLFTIQDPFIGDGMPTIGERERQTLELPETRYVLLMAETATAVDAGLRNLTAAGVMFSSQEEARWAYPPLTVYARLIALER